MQPYKVPVGQLEVTISCLMSPICPDVRSIPQDGMLLEQGEIAWTIPSSCPVIVATACAYMVVASRGEQIVAKVIKMLLGKGVRIDDIAIYMRFLPPAFESEYIEQAQHAGVRSVWATPLECSSEKHTLILIERT